jgi:hypothetical protein
MWESENQDESPLMTTDNFHGIDRLDLDRDDIAAAKLAIDRQVKQGEVTYSPLHEQSGSNRPNVLWSQGRSRPDQLAFVPRHAGVGRCAISIVWRGRTPLLQG